MTWIILKRYEKRHQLTVEITAAQDLAYEHQLQEKAPVFPESFFYFLIYLTNSSISGGNFDAGLPAATSVIHVAYTMYEVLSAEANS